MARVRRRRQYPLQLQRRSDCCAQLYFFRQAFFVYLKERVWMTVAWLSLSSHATHAALHHASITRRGAKPFILQLGSQRDLRPFQWLAKNSQLETPPKLPPMLSQRLSSLEGDSTSSFHPAQKGGPPQLPIGHHLGPMGGRLCRIVRLSLLFLSA